MKWKVNEIIRKNTETEELCIKTWIQEKEKRARQLW